MTDGVTEPVSQAARLAKPVPAAFVSQVPAGGGRKADYVSHAVITEILLAVVGPFTWEVREVRDKTGAITGAFGTLRCEVDGRWVSITEVGDTTGQETSEGGALKNAASDALKRAAMRLGLGLSLWSGADAYFLHRQLTKDAK